MRNKIALCRENTGFVSNTEDRKYPGCLPVFEEQALSCVDHFRGEAYKCDSTGSARIEDFTGFACVVTEVVGEADDDGTIEDDAFTAVDAEGQAETVESTDRTTPDTGVTDRVDRADSEGAGTDPAIREMENKEEERRNQAATDSRDPAL